MYYPHTYTATNAKAATKNAGGDWIPAAQEPASPITGQCRYEAAGAHNTDTLVIDGVTVLPSGVIYTKKNAALKRGQIISIKDTSNNTLAEGKILQVSTGKFNLRLWV